MNMIVVVMGVCSSGKTIIGSMLAERMGVSFYDGDEFHLPENVKKMKNEIPLNDDDRIPWLEKIAAEMKKWENQGGAVLACSALKESYRQTLRKGGDVRFVYLKGTKQTILERIKNRKGHFFPACLVDSQFETLEEPTDAIAADITKEPEKIVEEVLMKLQKKNVERPNDNLCTR